MKVTNSIEESIESNSGNFKERVEKAVESFECKFRVLCILSALSMCVYCVYNYIKDDDLTVVTFKNFQGSDENTYPQVTLCVSNEFSDENLKKINPNFSAAAYEAHLFGRVWNPKMVDLEYDKIVTMPKEVVRRLRCY